MQMKEHKVDSFRNIYDKVLLRASDNAEASTWFDHMGENYPVVVALDTNERRVRISLHDGVMMSALALARAIWGQGCEGNRQLAISPPGLDMYIADARRAAEFIKP